MLYIIYYIHWIESRLIFLYKFNKFRIPFYYTYFMVDYWSTLSWFNNSSTYCIKTTRLWNITINNDFAVTIYVRHRNDRNEKEERTKMKQETTYIYIYTLPLLSESRDSQTIHRSLPTYRPSPRTRSHIPTAPKASCHPPSPPRPREMNTPSWRHLIPAAHVPHNAPPPLLWGLLRSFVIPVPFAD